jgi:hypothetical protein
MTRFLLQDTTVNPAGLFRCCLFSLMEASDRAPDNTAVPGQEVFCRYCGERMTLDEFGMWNWDPENEPIVRRT